MSPTKTPQKPKYASPLMPGQATAPTFSHLLSRETYVPGMGEFGGYSVRAGSMDAHDRELCPSFGNLT